MIHFAVWCVSIGNDDRSHTQQPAGDEIMALDTTSNFNMTRRAMKAELLDAETEAQLAYAWRDHRDEEALHRLTTVR